VLDADIEACFESIDPHRPAGPGAATGEDKRVLALVRAFLKAGILTELGVPSVKGARSGLACDQRRRRVA
jgi:RNA-directed DNA polymerase